MTWGKGSRGQGSDDGGVGEQNPRHAMGLQAARRPRTDPALQSLVFSLWHLPHIQGPKPPWQLAGWVWRGHFLVCLPACLLTPGSSALAKSAGAGERGREQKILPCHSTPRSLLFMPRSLPTRVLSLFRAVQLAASLAGLSHPRVRSVNQAVR